MQLELVRWLMHQSLTDSLPPSLTPSLVCFALVLGVSAAARVRLEKGPFVPVPREGLPVKEKTERVAAAIRPAPCYREVTLL